MRLEDRWQGSTLVGNRYRRLAAAGDGSVASDALGSEPLGDGRLMRFREPSAGQAFPTVIEARRAWHEAERQTAETQQQMAGIEQRIEGREQRLECVKELRRRLEARIAAP